MGFYRDYEKARSVLQKQMDMLNELKVLLEKLKNQNENELIRDYKTYERTSKYEEMQKVTESLIQDMDYAQRELEFDEIDRVITLQFTQDNQSAL